MGSAGDLVESAPFIFQTIDGARHQVYGSFVMIEENLVGFSIGDYDSSSPLVIDPEFTFASYLGGSGFDQILAVEKNVAGHIFVGGGTGSSDFPLVNPHQGTQGGGFTNMFITRINPENGTIVYSTFLGGDESVSVVGLGIDENDNVFVTGRTTADDFPTLNAIQATRAAESDVVVAKFDPSGALLFSTYYGGDDDDRPTALDVDNDGNVWIWGQTESTDFPVSNDAENATLQGGRDLFMAHFLGDGSAANYSSYIGGSENETAGDLVVDDDGNVYVSGDTRSAGFAGSTISSAAGFVRRYDLDGINPPATAGMCIADGTGSDGATYLAIDPIFCFFRRICRLRSSHNGRSTPTGSRQCVLECWERVTRRAWKSDTSAMPERRQTSAPYEGLKLCRTPWERLAATTTKSGSSSI